MCARALSRRSLRGVRRKRRRYGLTPAAKAFWIARAASDDPRNDMVLAVVPADRDVEQITSDVRFFLGGLEGLSAAELEHASCHSRRRRSIRIAASRPTCASHPPAPGRCTRWPPGRLASWCASASALVPRVSAAGCARGAGSRPQARRRDRHAAPRRDADGRRIHAPGSRGRARRVLHPRRRGRHLPGRRRSARPHRARRRHHRGDPPLRARHAALRGHRRPVACGAVAGGGAGVRPARAVFLLPRHRGVPSSVVRARRDSRAHREAVLAQISESYEQTKGTEKRAPEEILVAWPDIQAQLAGAAVLEELGFDDPASSDQALPPPESRATSQPSLSFSGRLTEWIPTK